jgi:hypothetical protein
MVLVCQQCGGLIDQLQVGAVVERSFAGLVYAVSKVWGDVQKLIYHIHL